MVAKQPDLRPMASEPKVPNKPSPVAMPQGIDNGLMPQQAAPPAEARVNVPRLPASTLGRASAYLNRK